MIKIDNVTFAYPKGRANIHTNLSLNIEQNKIYGLLGKNGTGKSTLLYLISGLLRPMEGTITMDTTNEETLNFQVVDDEGYTYLGSKTIPAAYKPNGTFVSIKNATLTGQLGVKEKTGEKVAVAL